MLVNVCVVLLLFLTSSVRTESSTNKTIQEGQQKIAKYVRAILDHYKQKDPVGLPDIPIPYPKRIGPLHLSISIGKITMDNMTVHGLEKFKIDHIEIDLAKMIAEVAVTIEKLVIYGNYTMRSLFISSNGPFTVKLKKVYGKAEATLEVEREGYLEAQGINMDMHFKDINLNLNGSAFIQNVINSAGPFIFDSLKPLLLNPANAIIRTEVNKRTREFPKRFPNSISPIDQIMSIARQMVRKQGYDPYQVRDYNTTIGLFKIEMTHTWITGLSSFHRIGNMSFVIQNHTLRGNIEIGTQRLQGTSNWEMIIVGGLLSKAGTVKFSVEYFRVGILIQQSLDTRNKPQLEDVQLELGNIQIRFEGAGTLDYVIEFAVNLLPNVLRYQIMDALEPLIKRRIQEELDYINVEELIMENAEKYDEGNLNFTIPIKF